MAPVAPYPNGINDETGDKNVLTVLVTGFGPFLDTFPVNPSFEIAKRLPSVLPVTSEHKFEVRIVYHAEPVRVCYDEVFKLVPFLHESYANMVDLVLHIGMASGRQFYTLERYAHRDGYSKNKDVDGHMPSPGQSKLLFGDCPSLMTTSLDFDDTFVKWQENVGKFPEGSPGSGADVRPSGDAGNYLCDYIYFNSLAYYGRRSGSMEGEVKSDRPVLFLHVPAESDQAMLEKGQAVTIAVIRAIADSYAKVLENGTH